MLFEGASTFTVTKKSIKVYSWYFGGKKAKRVYTKHLSSQAKADLLNLISSIDTLQKFYFNYCVIATSGNETTVSIKSGTHSKMITLHHYYLKPIAELVERINIELPKKYKIHYLSRNTKQDCRVEDLRKKPADH